MDIAKLALEDGTVFTGKAFGARGESDGEVVFNTSMTGYQEVLTDPSYNGQIVTMTATQIGNYGINDEDSESSRPWVRGFVVRELSPRVSNYRATRSLSDFLEEHGVIGIIGNRHACPGSAHSRTGSDEGDLVDDRPRRCQPGREGQGQPGLDRPGFDARGHAAEPSTWELGLDHAYLLPPLDPVTQTAMPFPVQTTPIELRPHVVALDFGMKRNILRHLVEIGCRVTVDAGFRDRESDSQAAARRHLHFQRPG